MSFYEILIHSISFSMCLLSSTLLISRRHFPLVSYTHRWIFSSILIEWKLTWEIDLDIGSSESVFVGVDEADAPGIEIGRVFCPECSAPLFVDEPELPFDSILSFDFTSPELSDSSVVNFCTSTDLPKCWSADCGRLFPSFFELNSAEVKWLDE